MYVYTCMRVRLLWTTERTRNSHATREMQEKTDLRIGHQACRELLQRRRCKKMSRARRWRSMRCSGRELDSPINSDPPVLELDESARATNFARQHLNDSQQDSNARTLQRVASRPCRTPRTPAQRLGLQCAGKKVRCGGWAGGKIWRLAVTPSYCKNNIKMSRLRVDVVDV